jgi:hypothetical protein
LLSKYRRLPVALVAVCLTAGLTAGPAVAAAPSDGSPTAKSAQKPRATTESLRKRVVEAEEDLRATGKGIRFLLELSKRNENAVKFLTAAAPQLVNGLTSLRDASLQLKAGLETLGAAYTSVEYGAVQLFAAPVASFGAPPAPESDFRSVDGTNVNTHDIPDDGNTATISASIPFQASGPTDIVMRGTIRSNEIEGPGGHQGEMGGTLYVKCIGLFNAPACIGPGGVPFPAGATVCVLQPPDERTFRTPNGGETEQRLDIVDGSTSRSDRDRPTIKDESPTGDDDERCRIPGQGLYELTASVQFADIPETTTPSPRE